MDDDRPNSISLRAQLDPPPPVEPALGTLVPARPRDSIGLGFGYALTRSILPVVGIAVLELLVRSHALLTVGAVVGAGGWVLSVVKARKTGGLAVTGAVAALAPLALALLALLVCSINPLSMA